MPDDGAYRDCRKPERRNPAIARSVSSPAAVPVQPLRRRCRLRTRGGDSIEAGLIIRTCRKRTFATDLKLGDRRLRHPSVVRVG